MRPARKQAHSPVVVRHGGNEFQYIFNISLSSTDIVSCFDNSRAYYSAYFSDNIINYVAPQSTVYRFGKTKLMFEQWENLHSIQKLPNFPIYISLFFLNCSETCDKIRL